MTVTAMSDLLNSMYDAHDPNVRMLYKYRSCDPRHLDALQSQSLWFSTVDQLNDPYDCMARLPREPTPSDIEDVRLRLQDAAPYGLQVKDAFQIAELLGESKDLDTLTPLGLLATQFGHERLLKHIRSLDLRSVEWVRELVVMATEIAESMTTNLTVHCLSENRNHPLMWAHYSDGHKGFCAGYVCPVGIRNPALIHQVQYARTPPPITAWNLVEDPGDVWRSLALTKSDDWAYEREWRVIFGNIPGLLPKLLPCREIILGLRISPDDETRLRAAAGRFCKFYRATKGGNDNTYDLSIVPADVA